MRTEADTSMGIPTTTTTTHLSPRAHRQRAGAGGWQSPRARAPGDDGTGVPGSQLYVASLEVSVRPCAFT